MSILILRQLWLAGLLMNFTLAQAQPVPHETPTVPAKAPPLVFVSQYFSIFSNYQPYKEQPLLPWREANDNVGKIGGWRFYAREAQQPDAAPPSSEPHRHPPSGAPGAVDNHAEHGRKE